jgi:type IV pilus assembly protein PilW
VPGYGQFFAPVVITNGAAGASDTIELRVGTPVANLAPTTLAAPFSTTDEEIAVKRGAGFPLGTVLMIVGPTPTSVPATAAEKALVRCTVAEVTGFPDAGDHKRLSVAPAASGNTWNPTVAYRATNAWPSFEIDGTSVYTTGTGTGGMHFRTYTVNANGQLQVVNAQAGTTASTEVLVADVVKLHAQYGVSSAVGVQDIQKWVEPVLGGTYETNWNEGSLDADKITRIKAIRLSIVMRSPRLEAGVITGTCTTAGGVVNNGPCAWEDTVASPAPQIDLSADVNWQRYRYRVFQTIVPVRNIISAGV